VVPVVADGSAIDENTTNKTGWNGESIADGNVTHKDPSSSESIDSNGDPGDDPNDIMLYLHGDLSGVGGWSHLVDEQEEEERLEWDDHNGIVKDGIKIGDSCRFATSKTSNLIKT
jgi:hypothetical protein